MPELPEIETLLRKMRKTVIGKQIAAVSLSGLPLRKPVPETFSKGVRGRTVRRILRRGKYLVVELQPKFYWLIHLGMSGRLLYHAGSFRRTRHTHAVIRFTDASRLEYRDPRRFGLLDGYNVMRLCQIPVLRALGTDPLGKQFDSRRLQSMLEKSRRDLKSFLLDQKNIAGIGNIYACEALYTAGIHPTRRSNTLNSKEVAVLADAIRHVLRRAVWRGGTSFSDFIDLEGNPGKNQRYLNVFQRNGEMCMRCGDPIQSIRQGNRSTYFCARCQK